MSTEGTPLHLKAILVRHGISQTEWANCIRQPTGKPLHRVAANLILNGFRWPKTTPREQIETAIAELLRKYEVPEDEIELAWQPDDGDPGRHGRPQSTATPL